MDFETKKNSMQLSDLKKQIETLKKEKDKEISVRGLFSLLFSPVLSFLFFPFLSFSFIFFLFFLFIFLIVSLMFYSGIEGHAATGSIFLNTITNSTSRKGLSPICFFSQKVMYISPHSCLFSSPFYYFIYFV